MLPKNTRSRLDLAEQQRRRDLVTRAMGGVRLEAGSAKGNAVKQINDQFIFGEIDQGEYVAQLKVAIRGDAGGAAP